jgi:hypothetical protein
VAVVAAVELENEVAASSRAGEAQRRHRRLGAGGDETDHFDGGDGLDDALREIGLSLGGRAERGPTSGGLAHGFNHRRVRVTENERSERPYVVDVFVPIDVRDACRRT